MQGLREIIYMVYRDVEDKYQKYIFSLFHLASLFNLPYKVRKNKMV